MDFEDGIIHVSQKYKKKVKILVRNWSVGEFFLSIQSMIFILIHFDFILTHLKDCELKCKYKPVPNIMFTLLLKSESLWWLPGLHLICCSRVPSLTSPPSFLLLSPHQSHWHPYSSLVAGQAPNLGSLHHSSLCLGYLPQILTWPPSHLCSDLTSSVGLTMTSPLILHAAPGHLALPVLYPLPPTCSTLFFFET